LDKRGCFKRHRPPISFRMNYNIFFLNQVFYFSNFYSKFFFCTFATSIFAEI